MNELGQIVQAHPALAGWSQEQKQLLLDIIQRVTAAAVEHEREACARVAGAVAVDRRLSNQTEGDLAAMIIESNIRARSNNQD